MVLYDYERYLISAFFCNLSKFNACLSKLSNLHLDLIVMVALSGEERSLLSTPP